MARQPRIVVPGMPLHVIQRGNNREKLFLDANDFRAITEMLFDSSTKYACRIHAYVLMHNHIHLLLTGDSDNGPSRMMQSLGLKFVRYFNHRYARTGTAWEGRFKSVAIQSQQYFFACSRYIELNPVRAQMVDDPAAYEWSSFRSNAVGVSDRLITQHPLFVALGVDDTRRRAAYHALFANHLEPEVVRRLRERSRSGGVADGDLLLARVDNRLNPAFPALTPASALQL